MTGESPESDENAAVVAMGFKTSVVRTARGGPSQKSRKSSGWSNVSSGANFFDSDWAMDRVTDRGLRIEGYGVGDGWYTKPI